MAGLQNLLSAVDGIRKPGTARIRWVAVFRRKICERLGNPLTLIAMSPHEFQLNDAGGK